MNCQIWQHLQTFRLLVWSVSGVHQQQPVDESALPVAEFSSGNTGDGVAPVGCFRMTWSVCQLPDPNTLAARVSFQSELPLQSLLVRAMETF